MARAPAPQMDAAIQKAARADTPELDWAAALDVCDRIQSSPANAADAVRAIEARLGAAAPEKALLRLLELFQACVKNCGREFSRQASHSALLERFAQLVEPRVRRRPDRATAAPWPPCRLAG